VRIMKKAQAFKSDPNIVGFTVNDFISPTPKRLIYRNISNDK